MAELKRLKLKPKEHVIRSYGLDKDENPAKITFSRFPLPGETFIPLDKKNLLEGIDAGGISNRELESKIASKIVDNFLHNLQAGKTDYKLFFEQCVDCFKDLEYTDENGVKHKIITANDFWQTLPPEAAYTIAEEAFGYANEKEEFTAGNLKT